MLMLFRILLVKILSKCCFNKPVKIIESDTPNMIPPYCSHIWNEHSANGEDGLIDYFFSKIPNPVNFVVDIGANDGISSSNSRMLIERGWSGILVEPYSEYFNKLVILYSSRSDIQLFNYGISDKDEKSPIKHDTIVLNSDFQLLNINSFLERSGCPQSFGLLTIDTDGYDERILAAWDFEHYRLQLIIAEIDSSSVNNLISIVDVMAKHKYFPIIHIGNVIFTSIEYLAFFYFNPTWKDMVTT
jgi:FkbM family methyltransferase